MNVCFFASTVKHIKVLGLGNAVECSPQCGWMILFAALISCVRVVLVIEDSVVVVVCAESLSQHTHTSRKKLMDDDSVTSSISFT